MTRLAPPPLRLFRVSDPDCPPPPRRIPGSPLIEATWQRIAQKTLTPDRRVNEFHSASIAERDVENMRQAFVAGVYAASAALNAEGATSLELSEAAQRIEAAP